MLLTEVGLWWKDFKEWMWVTMKTFEIRQDTLLLLHESSIFGPTNVLVQGTDEGNIVNVMYANNSVMTILQNNVKINLKLNRTLMRMFIVNLSQMQLFALQCFDENLVNWSNFNLFFFFLGIKRNISLKAARLSFTRVVSRRNTFLSQIRKKIISNESSYQYRTNKSIFLFHLPVYNYQSLEYIL